MNRSNPAMKTHGTLFSDFFQLFSTWSSVQVLSAIFFYPNFSKNTKTSFWFCSLAIFVATFAVCCIPIIILYISKNETRILLSIWRLRRFQISHKSIENEYNLHTRFWCRVATHNVQQPSSQLDRHYLLCHVHYSVRCLVFSRSFICHAVPYSTHPNENLSTKSALIRRQILFFTVRWKLVIDAIILLFLPPL